MLRALIVSLLVALTAFAVGCSDKKSDPKVEGQKDLNLKQRPTPGQPGGGQPSGKKPTQPGGTAGVQ